MDSTTTGHDGPTTTTTTHTPRTATAAAAMAGTATAARAQSSSSSTTSTTGNTDTNTNANTHHHHHHPINLLNLLSLAMQQQQQEKSGGGGGGGGGGTGFDLGLALSMLANGSSSPTIAASTPLFNSTPTPLLTTTGSTATPTTTSNSNLITTTTTPTSTRQEHHQRASSLSLSGGGGSQSSTPASPHHHQFAALHNRTTPANSKLNCSLNVSRSQSHSQLASYIMNGSGVTSNGSSPSSTNSSPFQLFLNETMNSLSSSSNGGHGGNGTGTIGSKRGSIHPVSHGLDLANGNGGGKRHSAATAAAVSSLIESGSILPPSHHQPPPLGHHFVPIAPTYAATGKDRRILVYDSKSHPGHRREFAYKTRFTNRSGQTTIYYRCMACRSLKHRLQRLMWGGNGEGLVTGAPGACGGAKTGKMNSEGGTVMINGEKIPGVPCIAVKNDLLINDPDYPDANHHFCKPLTIDESKRRLQATLERGAKRSRSKQHPLDDLLEIPFKKSSPSLTATSSSTDDGLPHPLGGGSGSQVGSAHGHEEGSDGGSDEVGLGSVVRNGEDVGVVPVKMEEVEEEEEGDDEEARLNEAVVQRLCFWTNTSESGSCLLLNDENEGGDNDGVRSDGDDKDEDGSAGDDELPGDVDENGVRVGGRAADDGDTTDANGKDGKGPFDGASQVRKSRHHLLGAVGGQDRRVEAENSRGGVRKEKSG